MTAANFTGAALNYLFQVHAAAVLDADAFGLLSGWLAAVTMFGTVVTFVQFLSLEARLDDARWPPLARIAGFGALVVLVLHLVTGASASPLALGATQVVGAIALAAMVGQLQARLQLAVIAASLVVTTGLRFALPFAWPVAVRAPAFYLAHASASYAGMVVIGLAPARAAPAPEKKQAVRLGRPFLLGFATAVFPYVDVLAISLTQDAATTGAFARVALVARAIFFAGMAGLAVLLPHQMRTDRMPPFAMLLERFLAPAVVAGAPLAVLVLDALVLHTSGEERTWVHASSLAAAASVAVLGEVNRMAARGDLRRAAFTVAGVLLASAIGALTRGVSSYCTIAFAGNALVLVLARRR